MANHTIVYGTDFGAEPNFKAATVVPFPKQSATSSITHTIAMLRIEAGFPIFMVNDRVKVKTKRFDASLNGELGTVEDVMKVGSHPILVTGDSGWQHWYASSDLEFSRPFEVDEWVRIVAGEYAGQIGLIEDDDGTNDQPYLVTLLDVADGRWCDVAELEFWFPNIGDRVEAADKEETISAGTVMATDLMNADAGVLWDDTSARCAVFGPWDFGELMPSAVARPTHYEPGAVVEVIDKSKWSPDISAGNVGVITGKQDSIYGYWPALIADDKGESIALYAPPTSIQERQAA